MNRISIVGLDLAGVESRPTGFCILKGMAVETFLVCSDKEIVEKIESAKPKIVAVDVPQAFQEEENL